MKATVETLLGFLGRIVLTRRRRPFNVASEHSWGHELSLSRRGEDADWYAARWNSRLDVQLDAETEGCMYELHEIKSTVDSHPFENAIQ